MVAVAVAVTVPQVGVPVAMPVMIVTGAHPRGVAHAGSGGNVAARHGVDTTVALLPQVARNRPGRRRAVHGL